MNEQIISIGYLWGWDGTAEFPGQACFLLISVQSGRPVRDPADKKGGTVLTSTYKEQQE